MVLGFEQLAQGNGDMCWTETAIGGPADLAVTARLQSMGAVLMAAFANQLTFGGANVESDPIATGSFTPGLRSFTQQKRSVR